jgi:mono/diheme cytochrome c family protein
MPAWGEQEGGLRSEEIEKLVAYIRNMGGVKYEDDGRAKRWAKGDAAEGQRLYGQACALCHGDSGEGKEGPALKNRVFLDLASDTYLFKTIQMGRTGTSMPAFRVSSTVQKAFSDSDIESIVSFIRTWEEKR